MADSYPIVDLESDNDSQNESSDDDEAGVILHGTPQQKRRMMRRSLGHESDVSEDDFEKEMEAELNQTMTSLENYYKPKSGQAKSSGKESSENYAKEYFDSSSDEEGTSTEKADRPHPVISNDDLLYDPEMDDDDQRWVDSQRNLCQPASSNTTVGGAKGNDGCGKGGARKRRAEGITKLPNSDAVLNCPACMSLLCRDCQRHSVYNNQYRAMFVTNCNVDNNEVLKYSLKQQKKTKRMEKKGKKNKKKRMQNKMDNATSSNTQGTPSGAMTIDQNSANAGQSSAIPDQSSLNEGQSAMDVEHSTIGGDVSTNIEEKQSDDFESYKSVKCTVCTTIVGVIDEDEIVHFFNVLASY